MSDSKHSPGPWIVRNGVDVFTNTHPHGVGDIQIAYCDAHRVVFETDLELAREEAEANARLIAAAPELLEALGMAERSIVTMYRGMSPQANNGGGNRFADEDPCVIRIRAIIAKAKGGA